jgi:hypothetical protein
MARKLEAARLCRVLTPNLSSVVELIRSSQDRRRGYYRLNHVCTIVAGLIVCHAIGQCKRQKALFCDSIVTQ